MSANVEIMTDAGDPATSFNWGAIPDGSSEEYQFFAENTGDQNASSVLVSLARLNQNDGVDFALIAPDVGGNPGVYAASPLSFGTLAPTDSTPFWVKVTVPVGTTPGGNPRQFDVVASFKGI